MRALLILNEKARRGLQDGARVRELLKEYGIECIRDIEEPNVDLVIVAGGDGTVTWSVPLAIDRKVPLGIVPLGTFNDLARTLGIPLDVSEACRVIVERHTKTIDVGRVNQKYFVNESSVGLSTRIARKQTPEVKQRFGLLAVIGTALRSISETRPFFVELAYNGAVERFRSVQLTIANNKHFGGVIESPDAAIDDGRLDLYSVEARTWWQLFALVRKIVARDPSSGECLRTRRAARFEVRTHHAHHIEADGEPAGFTPAIFEVLPRVLEVVVPSAVS